MIVVHLIRKPLAEASVAENVLRWGCGALNIDAVRLPTDEDRSRPPRTANVIYGGGRGTDLTASQSHPGGRWPANLVLTHHDPPSPLCPAQELENRDVGVSRFFKKVGSD